MLNVPNNATNHVLVCWSTTGAAGVGLSMFCPQLNFLLSKAGAWIKVWTNQVQPHSKVLNFHFGS